MGSESRYEIGNKKVFNPPSSFFLSDVLSLPFLSLLCLGLRILFLRLLTINLLIQNPVNLRYWKGTFFSNLLWHIFTTREYEAPRSVLSNTASSPAPSCAPPLACSLTSDSSFVKRGLDIRAFRAVFHKRACESPGVLRCRFWFPGSEKGLEILPFHQALSSDAEAAVWGPTPACSWPPLPLSPLTGEWMSEANEAGPSKACTTL